MADLYGADDYLVTEMEDNAIAQVINRLHGRDRIAAIRGSVNFDWGNPNETTLQHHDPAPGETAGGFAETVENIALVGAPLADRIVADWQIWEAGVPALAAERSVGVPLVAQPAMLGTALSGWSGGIRQPCRYLPSRIVLPQPPDLARHRRICGSAITCDLQQKKNL